jgi:hypothetical protein
MTRGSRSFYAFLSASLLMLAGGRSLMAYEGQASNAQPLSFGFDQALIDLTRLTWGPLEHEGVPPGAEIALARRDEDGASRSGRPPARQLHVSHP